MGDAYTPVPGDTAEATRDLQERIGRFARAIFVIAAAILIASVALELALENGTVTASLTAPSRIVHVFAAFLLFAVWRRCRGKPMGLRVLEAVDAALTFALCTHWAMLGIGVPRTSAVEFSVVLALTHTVIGRSVLVPSSFRRTLWISTVSTIPVIVFLVVRGMPFIPNASPALVHAFVAFASVWCLVAVISAAVNSRQIFGLREQVREAEKLGQYTLAEKIGEGGMGVVYRATHAMLRRPAAIKLLLPERAGEKGLARFEREVQLTSRLAHPNTISIFDYGRTASGILYYVMEYLDGFDLEWLVDEEGPLEPARVIHILAQASGALSEAHALGLIHRDIKPANLVLTERADEPDVVKVVDFGLVKTIESAPGDRTVTGVDAITGTPMYLAPEAIVSPDSVDARSDLYALGAVGYFLLTGRHVFDAPTVVEVCSKHLLEAPVPPSKRAGRSFPPDLEALVLACLAKRPDNRPASAVALRTALLACADAANHDLDAARAWWRQRGASLRARSKAKRPVTHGATMAIDLRGREALRHGV